MAKEKIDVKATLVVFGTGAVATVIGLYLYHKAIPWTVSKLKKPATPPATPPL